MYTVLSTLCSGKGNRERSGIIKHSLHNGVVLTMENRVLLFPLMLGGFDLTSYCNNVYLQSY